MADSSFEKNLSELAKMKVADLKAELKQRGLPTTGNKTELVERLQLAIHDSSLSMDETNDEIIDEDAVLGDEEIENELTTKPDSQIAGEKRKSTSEENGTATKKIVLNRKSIVEEAKPETPKEEVTKKNGENKETETTGKKVIKLSEVSTNERLEMRAKKFGVPLTEAAKKEARAARFGTSDNKNSTNSRSAASIKNSNESASYEVLKKRAERFGTNVSSLLEKAELDEKKEKRKARFGEVKPIEKAAPAKIKLAK